MATVGELAIKLKLQDEFSKNLDKQRNALAQWGESVHTYTQRRDLSFDHMINWDSTLRAVDAEKASNTFWSRFKKAMAKGASESNLSHLFGGSMSSGFAMGAGAATAMIGIDVGLKVISSTLHAVIGQWHQANELIHEAERNAIKLGATAGEVSMLAYAGRQTETQFDAIIGSMQKMQKAIYEGAMGGDKAAAFRSLGIDAGWLERQTLIKQVQTLASALNSAQSPAERMAMTIAIFGKGGAEMLPMLNDLERAMGRLGGANFITEEQVARFERFEQSLKDVKEGLIGVGLAATTVDSPLSGVMQGAALLLTRIAYGKDAMNALAKSYNEEEAIAAEDQRLKAAGLETITAKRQRERREMEMSIEAQKKANELLDEQNQKIFEARFGKTKADEIRFQSMISGKHLDPMQQWAMTQQFREGREQLDRLERQKKAEEEAKAEAKQHVAEAKRLWEESLSPQEKVYLKQQRLNALLHQGALTQQDYLKAWEGTIRELQKADVEKVKQFYDADPLQKYIQTMTELDRLMQSGMLYGPEGRAVAGRAGLKAQKELMEAFPRREFHFVESALAGSRGDYESFYKAKYGGSSTDPQKQALDEAKKHTGHLQRIQMAVEEMRTKQINAGPVAGLY